MKRSNWEAIKSRTSIYSIHSKSPGNTITLVTCIEALTGGQRPSVSLHFSSGTRKNVKAAR